MGTGCYTPPTTIAPVHDGGRLAHTNQAHMQVPRRAQSSGRQLLVRVQDRTGPAPSVHAHMALARLKAMGLGLFG